MHWLEHFSLATYRSMTPLDDNDRRESSSNRHVTELPADTPIEDAPPAYGDAYGRVDLMQNGLGTVANVSSG